MRVLLRVVQSCAWSLPLLLPGLSWAILHLYNRLNNSSCVLSAHYQHGRTSGGCRGWGA
jgi:hypothetical protein